MIPVKFYNLITSTYWVQEAYFSEFEFPCNCKQESIKKSLSTVIRNSSNFTQCVKCRLLMWLPHLMIYLAVLRDGTVAVGTTERALSSANFLECRDARTLHGTRNVRLLPFYQLVRSKFWRSNSRQRMSLQKTTKVKYYEVKKATNTEGYQVTQSKIFMPEQQIGNVIQAWITQSSLQ